MEDGIIRFFRWWAPKADPGDAKFACLESNKHYVAVDERPECDCYSYTIECTVCKTKETARFSRIKHVFIYLSFLSPKKSSTSPRVRMSFLTHGGAVFNSSELRSAGRSVVLVMSAYFAQHARLTRQKICLPKSLRG